MRNRSFLLVMAFALGVLAAFFCPLLVSAQVLGTAQSFAVLGASTVTNTGPSTIYGNLGVYGGSAITGFPPGIVTGGTIHGPDGVSQKAQSDALGAYNTLHGLPYAYNLTGQDLGGMTLAPGIYHFDTSAQLTGDLTLDFAGDPDGMFVFQMGSTLTTASGSNVNVLNGSFGSGIYWQVGSSATLGTTTMFAGNIIADQSITLNTRADVLCGRVIALNGAVTLDNNRLSNDNTAEDFGSGRPDFGSYGFSGGSVPDVPEPSTTAMLLVFSGLAGVVALRKRSKKA